jgi:secondary thiamine-phosphate synthase enzyme
MVYREEIQIESTSHGHMQEITKRVEAIAARSGMQAGIVHIFNVGSTGIVGTIEYEPGLERDLPEMLDRLVPPSLDYGHERAWSDGNGHSHLQSTMMGSGITVPFAAGELLLGAWQQIFHMEADIRPRDRRILVTVIGE